ncbi:MAG: type VI secretion system tip protein VgrG [Desulfobulbus sp.]|nr:type VI secretion system tip protein VgrG [Desulfobulbus sp.]
MAQDRVLPTSRPATVVSPVILIEDSELARTWQVDSITVRKEVNRVAWAKVIILDGDASSGVFTASNDQLFIPGKKIEIRCGYQNDLITLFKGIIISHSVRVRGQGSGVLVLECRDAAVRMTVGRKNRYFARVKDSDAIARITGEYSGFTATAEASTTTHKELVQANCTDWDFILTRAEANGKICLVDDGTFSVMAPDPDQSPVLSLQYGATILEFDAEIDARHQLKKVTSRAWNPAEQSVLAAEGKEPGINLNSNLTPARLAEVIGLDEYIQNHGGALEEAELKAWGDALLIKRRLAKVRGRVKCKGIHTVKPGKIVELSGIGDRFDGRVFTSATQHVIAGGDWTTDIFFGLDPEWFSGSNMINVQPAGGLTGAMHGLQAGIVTQIDNDPDGEFRIRVRLPLISPSEEGTWARLATLDAGHERGTFFLPEVGDEVIVGFINDDPRHAVVLGMLHSSALPAPLTAEEKNPQKGYVSRANMRLLFDDESKTVTLETPAGKTIVLDEESDTITISDDHQNRLVMDSSGIIIESQGKIEIKAQQDLALAGLNAEMKAQSSLTVEGTASAEVKAGGTMTVQGAMVQIN